MSHVSSYKLSLNNVNADIFKGIVEVVGKELDMEVTDTVGDYRGENRKKIFIGLRGNGLPNGIGFNIDIKGNLEVVGDDWGKKGIYQKVQEKVVQYYVATSIGETMKAKGYRVRADQDGDAIVFSCAKMEA